MTHLNAILLLVLAQVCAQTTPKPDAATICPKCDGVDFTNNSCVAALSNQGAYFCDTAPCNLMNATVKVRAVNYIMEDCKGYPPTKITAKLCVSYQQCANDVVGACNIAYEIAPKACDSISPDASYCTNCSSASSSANATVKQQCKDAIKAFTVVNNCSDYLTSRNKHTSDYTLTQYEIAYPVDMLHSTPRVIGGNTFPMVSQDTVVNITDPYFTGIIAMIASMATVGVLGLIIVSIYNCCCRKEPAEPKKLLPRLLFAFVVSWGVIAIIIGFNANTSMDTSISLVGSTIDDLQGIFTDASNAATAASNVINDTQTVIQQIIDKCPSGRSAVELKLVNEALVSSQTSIDELYGVADNFTVLDTVSLTLNTAGGYSYNAVVGISVVFFLPVFVFGAGCICAMCCAARCAKCCKMTGCVAMPFLMLILLLAWIFSGVFLGLGVVISDICVDPDTFITSFMNTNNDTSNGNGASSYLNYYTTCRGNNQILDYLVLAENQMQDGEDTLSLAEMYAVLDCRDQGVAPLYVNLTALIRKGVRVLHDQVEPIIACPRVNQIYRKIVYELFCGTLPDMLNNLWIACLLLGLMILICSAFYFNIISPGGRSVTAKVGFRDPYSMM